MGSKRHEQVNKLCSQSLKGRKELLHQEDHGHRSLNPYVSHDTQGSGNSARVPSVLETRQRSIHNTPLPT